MRIPFLPVLSRAIYFIPLCVLTAATALPLGAADRIVTGEYEFSNTTNGKTDRLRTCITAEDAIAINGNESIGRQHVEKALRGNYTIERYEITENRIVYVGVIAAGEEEITSLTKYYGDSFERFTTITHFGNSTTTRTIARRVGACR